MTPKINTQQGFGVIEIVAIFATVALIGSVGWVAYNSFVKPKPAPAVASTATSHQPSPSTQSAASPPSTQAITGNSIKIPELGISLTVPDSLKDLTYTYNTLNETLQAGKPNVIVGTASFSTKSLTVAYPKCSSDGTAPPLGRVSKITGTYVDGLGAPYWDGRTVRQFADSYLVLNRRESVCEFSPGGAVDQNVETAMNTDINDLIDALKNAKEL